MKTQCPKALSFQTLIKRVCLTFVPNTISCDLKKDRLYRSVLGVAVLTACFFTMPRQADAYSDVLNKSTYPSFSWDTAPRALIFRNNVRTSDQDVTNIADHYQVVVMEKSSHEGFTYTEDGINDLSTRLKAENSDIMTLAYWNSYRRWGGYFANIEFDQNPSWVWEIDHLNSTVSNQWDTGYQQWWIDTGLGMANLPNVDGLFLDMVHLHIGSTVGSYYGGDLYLNGVAQHPKAEMIQDLSNQLPATAFIASNGVVIDFYASSNSNGYLNVMDGAYKEGWDSTDPDNTVTMIDAMRDRLLKGKMVMLRTGPNHSVNLNGDTKPTTGVEADVHDWAERNADFPLAVFLMLAEPHAYLMYSEHAWAIDSYEWETSYVDRFAQPLGYPLDAPVKNGYVYTRSFQYVDVTVDVQTGATTLDWRDASSGNGSGTYQAEYAVNNNGTRKTDSAAQVGTYIDGEQGFNLTFEVNATAGPADLDFRVCVPSGTRQMGVFVNGSRVGTVNTSSTAWITKTVSTYLEAGKNTIELRDTDGTLELNVDYLEVASSGAATYEAERDTELSGCSIKSLHAGYSGDGYVDMGGNGTWLEWDGVNASAGTKTFNFSYAATSGRPCDISVNGTVVGQVSFPSTGSWTNWSTATINVPLSSGYNTVRVTAATSAGGPNIDSLLITSIPTSIFASDDAYTRDSSFADDNFGDAEQLVIKDSNAYLTRRSFMKFPVEGYSQASEVNLILTVDQLQSSGTGTIELRELSDDSWSEDSITWNNQPTQGALIQSFTVLSSDVGNELSIDVTSYVTGEAAGDGAVSFILVQPSGVNTFVGFSSGETSSGPYLEVE